MRRTWARFGWLTVAAGIVVGAIAAPARGSTIETLRRDVETLSSPSFEGRGVGTKGLEKAREYVEKRFREAGLAPLGVDGYRQPFPGPKGTTLVNLIGVMGKPEGSRYVIVGAHYDHLGFGQPGEANFGKMFPGADDNASGIAAILECARRLGKEEKPLHPVIFIAFSGEEEGLLGSKYYVEHPMRPLRGCIAMVNLDTVGRLFDKHLFVFGTGTAEELPRIVKNVNYGFRFDLELPERDPGASDQVSFSRRGVPAVQIFSGPHADYHRPTDTPDKIDYEGLNRIAAMTTELVLYLANRDKPLTFVPPGAAEAARQASGALGKQRRVSFGSIPDFNHSGGGVLVSGVIPDSPAEKAGLKEGDLIVEFAGVAVDDLRSFSDILKGLSPGEETTVVFLRNGERHEVTTTVVERK